MFPSLQCFPSPDEFRELAKRGNFIPLIVDVVADVETPVSAFAKICGQEPSFLFESAEKKDELGRFSFLGTDPVLIFQTAGTTVSVTENGRTHKFETSGDPLSELQTVMERFRFVAPPDIPHFIGGAVGFIGYDMVRLFEPTVPIHPGDDLRLPEMMFMIARTMIVFDHRFRRLRLVSNAYLSDSISADEAYLRAKEDLRRTLQKLNQPTVSSPLDAQPVDRLPNAKSNTTRPEFESMVERAKELIAAGDIFQVVLSQRLETEYSGDALDLYRCLRFGNPSPYMFYLKFGDEFAGIGSSPELHVRVRDGKAEIRPIAGTRPRGTDFAEDERLAQDLIRDPKERAEHVMLIDLGRNDLGRVAEFGTVKVTEQMVIERYSHVMHIVSHIAARLRQDKTTFDAVRATFPAGTVSGAPKIRAMQIIAELEKSRRGFYAGIVGYFGFDGTLDSCIALRSIVLKQGKAYLQAGAGIVADSDPAREYDETMNKAKAMLEAIARANKVAQSLP
jgi:anthranilate synthase component 1